MKRIFAAFIILSLMSCGNDQTDQAIINYHITVKPSTQFELVDFTFEYARVHRTKDGVKEIRTVYLDPKDISTPLNQRKEFVLGASEIEPVPIEGYDFGLTSFTVVKDQDTIFLQGLQDYSNYTSTSITPVAGQMLNVTFELDLEASVLLDSAGTDWIKPRLEIQD